MKDSKQCGRCLKTLPLNLENFYKKGTYFSNRCKVCTRVENKANYNKHRESYLEQKKQYWIDNKDSICEYRTVNKVNLNNTRRKRTKYIRANYPKVRVRKNIGELIRGSFKKKGFRKSKRTVSIIGCSHEFLFDHLVRSFEDNYLIPWNDKYMDSLHIDHIEPINNASTIDDILKLNHYGNLQLLYSVDNILKSCNNSWELNLYETEFYNKCL